MPMVVPPSSRSPLSLWLFLLLPLLALAVYFNTVNNSILASDAAWSTGNPQVVTPSGPRDLLLTPSPSLDALSGAYRPVLVVFLRAQWNVWGQSPSSYHAVGLLLLLANVLLMIGVAGRLLDRQLSRAAAVLLLAAHPMGSQAVHTIAGQGLQLALFFTLAALAAALFGRDRVQAGRDRLWPWMLAALVGCLLAAGSHELGLLSPLLIALLVAAAPALPATTTVGRGARSKARPLDAVAAAAKAPAPSPARIHSVLLLPLLAAPLLMLLARWFALGGGLLVPAESRAALATALGGPAGSHFLQVFGSYFARLLWPVSPTVLYAPQYGTAHLLSAQLGGLVFVGVLIAIAVLARRLRVAAAGLAWAALTVLALSQLVPLGRFMSEEPLLFALPGLGLCLGGVLQWLLVAGGPVPSAASRKVAVAVQLVTLGGLAAWASLQRGAEWKTAETLWAAEAALHPQHPQPHIELLDYFARAELWARALAQAEVARPLARGAERDGLVRRHASLLFNLERNDELGTLLDDEIVTTGTVERGHALQLADIARRRGMAPRQMLLLRREIERYPNNGAAIGQLADLLLARKDPDGFKLAADAIKQSTPAERPAALARYGVALYQSGNLKGAQAQLLEALRGNPRLYSPYVYLMEIQITQGNWNGANELLGAAFSRASVTSVAELAQFYTRIWTGLGQPGRIEGGLLNLIERFPRDVDLRMYVAQYLLNARRYDRAETLLLGLTQLSGSRLSDVLYGLAVIALDRDHRPDGALQLLERAERADPTNQAVLKLRDELRRSSTKPSPTPTPTVSTLTAPVATPLPAPFGSTPDPAAGGSLIAPPPAFQLPTTATLPGLAQ